MSWRPLGETAGKRRRFSALVKPRSTGVWAIQDVTVSLRRHHSGEEDSGLEAFVGRCLSCDEGDQYTEAHRRLDRVLSLAIWKLPAGTNTTPHRLGISRESLGRRLHELGLYPSRAREREDEREQTLIPLMSLADIEWEHIRRVLSATHGNGPRLPRFSASARPPFTGVCARVKRSKYPDFLPELPGL